MNCPVCKTQQLTADVLESQLPAKTCGVCAGHWLDGESYDVWLERHAPTSQPVAEVSAQVRDSGPAKLCPQCGRFLIRYRVGHGTDFHIDRCGGCRGLWFDGNEWEILRARGLHDDVHFVFSAAWQMEFVREQEEESRHRLFVDRLGEADFAELRRVKAWLEKHPHRDHLYAYLMDKTKA